MASIGKRGGYEKAERFDKRHSFQKFVLLVFIFAGAASCKSSDWNYALDRETYRPLFWPPVVAEFGELTPITFLFISLPLHEHANVKWTNCYSTKGYLMNRLSGYFFLYSPINAAIDLAYDVTIWPFEWLWLYLEWKGDRRAWEQKVFDREQGISRRTPEEVIAPDNFYSTDESLRLARKHRKAMESLHASLRRETGHFIDFAEYKRGKQAALSFRYGREGSAGGLWLSLAMYARVGWTMPGDRDSLGRRAATKFRVHGEKYARMLCRSYEILADPEVRGIALTMTWRTSSSQKSLIQGFTLWTAKDVCEAYSLGQVTIWEFINRSTILGLWEDGSTGEIQLDFGDIR